MADLQPFYGIHYNPGRVSDLAKVIIPPYDVISPEEQRLYHESHPYNFIRLALGESLPSDNETANRYTRAASCLESWLRKGVLIRDESPSLYVFEQPYRHQDKILARRGIIGLVGLEPYETRVILPHEKTLAAPKEDRLQLMRSTRANLDSVFGLYEDNAGVISNAICKVISSRPLLEFTEEGVRKHRLWRISGGSWIERVRRYLFERQILIADGHHRYETALAYREEQRAAGSCNPSEGFVLMALVDSGGEGLAILPTHRLVGCPPEITPERLLQALDPHFAVEPISRSELQALIAFKSDGHHMGLYAGDGRAFHLTLAPEGSKAMGHAGTSPIWQNLDVVILHTLILNNIFGLDSDEARSNSDLAYMQDEEAAIAAVDEGSYRYAFLLCATDVKTMWQVARARERMPQKSTYFYPKLCAGLVLRCLQSKE